MKITKEQILDKLGDMFEEEWYTNRSNYEDGDGNPTQDFEELQSVEEKVKYIINKFYEEKENG